MLLLTGIAHGALAQIYGPGVHGYFPIVFNEGNNLFCNPLENGSNTLAEVFAHSTPVGTTISIWDQTNGTLNVVSTFTNGAWSANLVLPVGMGVSVFAPVPFTNWTSGLVLNHDESLYTTYFPRRLLHLFSLDRVGFTCWAIRRAWWIRAPIYSELSP